MAKTERTYNVPLRKGFSKAPRYKKTKKAVITLREFLVRHMKCKPEDIKLGKHLNEKLWERGYRHPPHHIKITVIKEDDGKVKAELFGVKYDEPVKQAEKEEKKTEKKAEEKDVKELEKELEKVVEKDEKKEEKAKKKETKKKTVKKTTEEKPKKASKKKEAKE